MKILITGGLGFVGSHLSSLLSNDGHEVIVLSRTNQNRENLKNTPNIAIQIVDITNLTLLQNTIKEIRPDVIFHLAGQTSHKLSFENPLYDVEVNIKSTVCILETIRNFLPSCKFILGSTFVVIGRPKELPVTESSPCNPTTIYGVSKLASEFYSEIYHEMYGLETIVFRITNSFGPREQYLTPTKNAINYLIYQAYKKNEVTIYDDGKFFRDVIYIHDVVLALKAIMNSGTSGRYWISSGKKTWFYELGSWLNELTGAKIKYIPSPEYTKKVDVGNFVVDNSKLQALGWKPNIEVKKGIELTIDYFKTNNL